MKHRLPRPGKTLHTVGLMLGGLSLAACAFSWNGFTLREWWREHRSGTVVWQANTRHKVVALTFDDGPDPRNTPRVLAILKRYGVPATFFVVGRRVEACPDLAREIVAEGHALGNHTMTHPYLNRKTPADVRMEMESCERCLETTLRRRTHLFRSPRGAWNPTIFREVQRAEDHLVLWTVALEHREVHTPRAMSDRALRLLKPGGIVLLHDGGTAARENTVQALPLLLDGLRQRGYRCVTVPELLHIRGDEPLDLLPPRLPR